MTDERLLGDFLSIRDGVAFETLVRRHGPMVFRVCREVLGDRSLAEDAFQATFLVLLRQAGAIRDRGSLGSWLYGVAVRISRRERRLRARLRFQDRQVAEMNVAAAPDFDPADGELKPILHDEIGRLPSKLRDPIVACYFDGMSIEEAARRLDCPVGTLRSRLAKGRELLHSRLTRRGLAASALLLLMFSMTEEVTADLSESLLDNTLAAGSGPSEEFAVSRRVAAMVLREEAGPRLAWAAGSWALIVVLILALGIARLDAGRKVQAAPAGLPLPAAPEPTGERPAPSPARPLAAPAPSRASESLVPEHGPDCPIRITPVDPA